ncbi:WhiB family transcriptional regulator [Klenkia sesuvii]
MVEIGLDVITAGQEASAPGSTPARRVQEDHPMADIRRLPTPVAEVWDWQLHGSCRGESTSLFFHPDGERGPARARRQAAAKAVCGTCPVIDACLKHALSVREPYGVWGGMSEEERTRLIAAENAPLRVGV